MNEMEELKLKIGNLVFRYWQLLPEQRCSYTKYYQEIDKALDNWHLSSREKRIAAKEKGNAGI